MSGAGSSAVQPASGAAADRQRTRLCAAIADRGRTAVRDILATLGALLDHRYLQTAVLGLDLGARFGAARWGPARAANASRKYSPHERRQLPAALIRQPPITPGRSKTKLTTRPSIPGPAKSLRADLDRCYYSAPRRHWLALTSPRWPEISLPFTPSQSSASARLVVGANMKQQIL